MAVSATLKNSHAQELAGRRFAVESDGGPRSRALTDANGTLSLRLIPNATYTLRPLAQDEVYGIEPNSAFLVIRVDASGEATVAESRKIFASNFLSGSPADQTGSESAAKFQSARFGESVFAP